jgi:plasmid maintenance system killer protein
MKITFAKGRLALIGTDEAHKTGFPIAAIKPLRRKLQAARAAPDERAMRNWKGLHFLLVTCSCA